MTNFEIACMEAALAHAGRGKVWPVECAIPVSVRSPSVSLTGWPFEKPATECWECSAPLPVGLFGPYQFCGGCRASQRQQAREDAHRERFPEEGEE